MATFSRAPGRFPGRPLGGISWAAFALLAACGGSGKGTRDAAGEDAALEAYRRGDFDRAEALGRGGTSLESRILRARLGLLRNRPAEAIETLYPLAAPFQPFTAKVPSKYDELQVLTEVLSELSQAYVRSDDFSNAGRVYKALGDNILATKYEALARLVAYLPTEGLTEVSVPLDAVDPVPHFTMDVNGHPGVFLVDTSIDEIVIEREFAKRAGLRGFGVTTKQYNVAYDESTAGEITIGKLSVKNVPVHLGRLQAGALVRADGAVGLAFLMHFDFTLDYRRSRLTLRRPGSPLGGGIPAVVAGARYLLVQGSVNGKAGFWIQLNTALPDVLLAASPGMAQAVGPVRELAVGPIRLLQPPVDTDSFPIGLDGGFGFPAGFTLAHPALREHSIRLEPRSMKVHID